MNRALVIGAAAGLGVLAYANRRAVTRAVTGLTPVAFSSSPPATQGGNPPAQPLRASTGGGCLSRKSQLLAQLISTKQKGAREYAKAVKHADALAQRQCADAWPSKEPCLQATAATLMKRAEAIRQRYEAQAHAIKKQLQALTC